MPLIDNTLYNELPSLETAYTRRQVSIQFHFDNKQAAANNRNHCDQAKHIDNLIQGPLRDVFIRYGAHKTFALYLQHRHHRLGRKEAIVKVHGTAHLMNEEDIVDIETMGNKIIPATWMGKDMLAIEYAVAPTSYARQSFSLPQVATLNPLPSTWLVTLTCVVLSLGIELTLPLFHLISSQSWIASSP